MESPPEPHEEMRGEISNDQNTSGLMVTDDGFEYEPLFLVIWKATKTSYSKESVLLLFGSKLSTLMVFYNYL